MTLKCAGFLIKLITDTVSFSGGEKKRECKNKSNKNTLKPKAPIRAIFIFTFPFENFCKSYNQCQYLKKEGLVKKLLCAHFPQVCFFRTLEE